MGNRIGVFELGYLDQVFGDDRPGERRTQQIEPLVDRSGLHRRKGVFAQELVPQILDVCFAGPAGLGLGLQTLQLIGPLADVRGVGDHLATIVLLEPRNDH